MSRLAVALTKIPLHWAHSTKTASLVMPGGGDSVSFMLVDSESLSFPTCAARLSTEYENDRATEFEAGASTARLGRDEDGQGMPINPEM